MRPDARLTCLTAVVAGTTALSACDRAPDRKLERESLPVTLASVAPAEAAPSAADRAALDSMNRVRSAIEAVFDSVYRVMRQATRERTDARDGRDDTVAMLRNETARLALAVMALRDSLVSLRQRNVAVGDAGGQELALAAPRNAAAMDRLHQLLAERDARLDSLTAEAKTLRDSLASSRGDSTRLVQQLEAFAAELATARTEVETLQAEVARLSGKVQTMDGEAHRVAACVGTGEDLRDRGVVERRGGVRGAFAAWTVRRGASFDECGDWFDWREAPVIPLPGVRKAADADQFEVLSAHDPSLLEPEAISTRRYGLVIRSPERFWAAGPVLVVRLK